MDIEKLDLKRHWEEQGYIVVRGLIGPSRIERLRAICEEVLRQWLARDPETGKPSDANNTVMRHLNNSAYFPHDRMGFIELMELGADEETMLKVVRAATGFEPMFRTFSLFFNPATRRVDGNWHRDSQFMSPTEAGEKEMIFAKNESMQLQVALIASEDSEYVPRSHLRLDTPEEYHIRKGDGGIHCGSNAMPGALRVALQPGDAVAFNPMGLHRGRYYCDSPRRTLMLTYTSVEHPWHDQFTMQPWFAEPGYLDGLSPRARRFYEQFIDVFHQDWPKDTGNRAGVPSGVVNTVR